MKTILMLTGSLLMFAISSAASAQSAPAANPPGFQGDPRAGGGRGGGDEGAGNGEGFQKRKAEILSRLSAHMAEIQKVEACVQAASTPEGLKGCKPQRPQGSPQ